MTKISYHDIPLTIRKSIHHCQGKQDEDHHYQGHCRARVIGDRVFELTLDGISDQVEATASQLLRNVKEGDYIKIEGYLVYLYYSNEDGRGEWTSSLTRTDRGDGACEVIYVKNITWLKTK